MKKVTLVCCNCDHEWEDGETWSSPYCPKCNSQVIKEKGVVVEDKPEIESFERNGQKIHCVIYKDSVGEEHFTKAEALAELEEYCKNKQP